ncbi:MAG: SDR family NAD(P)-dependent oxidoreductase [Chloroflexi bacterium]|nr:SDR family NAD(P)-dependent oxidoreductase [Chloroflexota bacterium]
MRDFKAKVAVVTGAASGIGLGLAQRCAQEGMRVVLADVEEEALAKAVKNLQANGAKVLGVRTDVSQAADLEALAARTLEAYGGAHLLFNNAGVFMVGTVWESTVRDWEWILGVNLWGVIHGVRTFVPIMLGQDEPCHIVNTASIGGFLSGAGTAAYGVTKHAVVSLSEKLYEELAERDAKIGVSVLSPNYVDTQIFYAERNRPGSLENDASQKIVDHRDREREATFRQNSPSGTPPSQIADTVFEAILNDKFYIFPHAQSLAAVKTRFDNILAQRNPTMTPRNPPSAARATSTPVHERQERAT